MKKTTIVLPNGKKTRVVSAEELTVGAFMGITELNDMINGEIEADQAQLVTKCWEILNELLPDATKQDLNSCPMNQVVQLVHDTINAVTANVTPEPEPEEEGEGAVKKAKRRRGRSVSK